MRKKLIIVFVVFTAIGVGIFYFLTTGDIGAKYSTVEVKRGEVGNYVQDVGRISSKNIRRYYGNGVNKVAEMTLKLGDYITKGQLLIRYEDTLNLEIQKVEKQIEALEAVYKEVLSGTDIENISSARIEVSRIRTQLELATKDKERTELLYTSGATSLIELERSADNMEELQSSLKIAQNTYNQLSKGISENIREKYEAEIDVLFLTLAIVEKNREAYVMYADIDGVITELNTFEGDIPSPGTLIVELQDPTEKIILVDFMVEDAINIRPNLKAEIKDMTLGINIENLKVNQVYPKAFVSLSELSVEENRQTVEIGLPKSIETLPYGLEVKTKVMIEAPREILLVPVGAIFQKNSKHYVRVLEEGNPVEREIITGIKFDGNIEIKDGVVEGDLVILNYQAD